MTEGELDLGHDHYLRFTRWAPDDLPANRERLGVPDGEPMPVVERAGAIVRHRADTETGWCEGGVMFDLPELPGFERQNRWTVVQWEPLTLDPSLLCSCGDHGVIRDGQWMPA